MAQENHEAGSAYRLWERCSFAFMMPIRKILIPLIDVSHALPYLRLAGGLLPPEGKILALKIVEIPEEESLSVGAEKAPIYRASLEELSSQFPDGRVELKSLVRVSRQLREGIAETAREEACDLLLLPWKGYSVSEERLFGGTIDRLLEEPPCNIVVVRAGDFSTCKRILFPVRGGPYATFSLEVASRLALSLGAEVTVLHCEQRFSTPGFGNRAYQSFLRRLQLHPHIKRLTTLQGDPKAAIIEEAKAHDMVMIGAGFKPEPHDYFLGPIVEHVALKTDKPLVVVKTPSMSVSEFDSRGAEEGSLSLSERVDKWFAENTFHRREFEDLQKLVELKERQGLTISLGLPALNEAETVGHIIHTIKQKLFDEVPLLDEIVLIDSGSTDDTVRIAEDLGVAVYVHQHILPQYGAYRGKGEALWKSLYVLKGDIVVWIDTDIKGIHPGFVYGLLGPLLREPDIQYVKGFYRRPLKLEGGIHAEGGGRVTELTARPFLNLFFPELSGILQPLAGEYGGRREALERVPFFTGYGVETGLLIDLFNQFGLRAIAQVDLEERIHRNQSLAALSQMSFAVIQVFMQRLEERNMIKLLEEVNKSMKLIKTKQKSYALEVKEIRDHERPPMISIAEYQVKRQKIPPPKTPALH
ncbi:MAG: glucosyl-3-phosphoglycerate synthase [Candidatus Binatia bacterium]